MSNFERNVAPRGAVFSRGEDGEVYFCFEADPATVVGPRLARESDQETHPAAWAAFQAAENVSPLDRDADGEDGGSLQHDPKPAAKPKASRKKVKTDEPAVDRPDGG